MPEYSQPINLLEKVVVVNNISDFPEAIVVAGQNVITLEENIVYEFGAGMIDLGDNHFVITNGVKLRGQGIAKTVLTTMLTDGVLFACPGDNSGAVEFEHFQFLCNDTDVILFDISFVQRVYLTGVFFFHVGALGWLENIDTFRTDSTTAFVGFNDPLRFRGTNGAVLLDRTGLINVADTPSPYIIFLEEDTIFNNIFQVAGCIVLGFPGTFGIGKHPSVTFDIFGIGTEEAVYFGFNNFRGGLTPLDGFDTDIDNGVVKSRFNFGLMDTHIFGSLYFSTPAQTTFAGVNTPVKAEGVTTNRLSRGWIHANNQLTYALENPLQCLVEVKAYITAEATVTNVSIYIAKDGVIDPDSRCQVYVPAGGAIAVTDGIYDVDLATNFEIWVENNTNGQWVQLEDKATRMKVTTL